MLCVTIPRTWPMLGKQVLNMAELIDQCNAWRYVDARSGATFRAACASFQPGADLRANMAGEGVARPAAAAHQHHRWRLPGRRGHPRASGPPKSPGLHLQGSAEVHAVHAAPASCRPRFWRPAAYSACLACMRPPMRTSIAHPQLCAALTPSSGCTAPAWPTPSSPSRAPQVRALTLHAVCEEPAACFPCRV